MGKKFDLLCYENAGTLRAASRKPVRKQNPPKNDKSSNLRSAYPTVLLPSNLRPFFKAFFFWYFCAIFSIFSFKNGFYYLKMITKDAELINNSDKIEEIKNSTMDNEKVTKK